MREMIICELAPTLPPRPPKPAPGVATAFHPGSKFSPPDKSNPSSTFLDSSEW